MGGDIKDEPAAPKLNRNEPGMGHEAWAWNPVVTLFWAAFHTLPKRFRFRWQSQQQLLYTYPTFFTGLEKVLLPPRSVDISETGQNRNFATGVMQLSLAVEQAANILQPGQTSRKHAVTPAFELHRCFTIARLLFQV